MTRIRNNYHPVSDTSIAACYLGEEQVRLLPNVVRDLLVDCLYVELESYTEEEVKILKEFLAKQVARGVGQFLIPTRLPNLFKLISEESVIQSFVVGLAVREAACITAFDDLKEIVESIIEQTKQVWLAFDHDTCVLNVDARSERGCLPGEIEQLFQGNPWIRTLYLCLATGAINIALTVKSSPKAMDIKPPSLS